MKLKNTMIYVIGTLSVIAIGLIVVGGVALFMTNRIEFATANHAQREAERITEVGEEHRPEQVAKSVDAQRRLYEDAEFIIEDIENNRLNNGKIEWRTTETETGDYQSGTISFYVVGDKVNLNMEDSVFPRYIDYRDEMNDAIEGEMQTD